MLPFAFQTSPPGHALADASRRRRDARSAPGPDIDSPPLCSPGGLPRLLLIERDAAMRVMLATMLSTHYRVNAIGDYPEAGEAAKLQPPDLIIIDLYAPGTDDLTLIGEFRAEARTAHLPIILLTTSMHKELLLRSLAAGASNFVLKPFNATDLLMCASVELQLRRALAGPGR